MDGRFESDRESPRTKDVSSTPLLIRPRGTTTHALAPTTDGCTRNRIITGGDSSQLALQWCACPRLVALDAILNSPISTLTHRNDPLPSAKWFLSLLLENIYDDKRMTDHKKRRKPPKMHTSKTWVWRYLSPILRSFCNHPHTYISFHKISKCMIILY